MNKQENDQGQAETSKDPNAPSEFSSKFFVLLTGLVALLGIAIFINDQATLPSFSAHEFNNSASAVPALQTARNANRNNVFSVKALNEFRLFAPILKPISNNPMATKASMTTNAPRSSVVVPKPIITPPASTIVNPLDLPVLKPVANPLNTPVAGKNDNPSTAVVNILCSQTIGKNIKQISSSGVLISSSGLILTNAHVGIHPFIAAYGNTGNAANVGWSCKIRSGSPAQTSHQLSFIYMSSTWTDRHRGETSGTISIDSGEGDFSILKASNPGDILKFATPIMTRNGKTTNPLELFALNANSSSNHSFSPGLAIGQQITAIGYPILSGDSNSLLKKQDQLSIRDLFGFSGQGNGKDLLETSASSIGKSGSSGGAIVDSGNHLIGLIANVIPTQNPDRTYIRGISLDHISSSLLQQAGISLVELMNGDGSSLKQIFESRYLQTVKANLL